MPSKHHPCNCAEAREAATGGRAGQVVRFDSDPQPGFREAEADPAAAARSRAAAIRRRAFAPTRPSCLHCVEKHLGAAYVLLTETRDGYAHRLRAIGHLHEAEDESQEWPDLHAAIREARKAYQAGGAMPTWDTLAEKAGQAQ